MSESAEKACTTKDGRRPYRSPPRIICDEAPCPRSDLEGSCHIFRGRKTDNGYGITKVGKLNVLVHRYLWERWIGLIPEEREIDHQCRNRACCNLDHLRVVTRSQNVRENVVGHPWQLGRSKTHCKRGHLLDKANVYVMKCGGRRCRKCAVIFSRNHRIKKGT